MNKTENTFHYNESFQLEAGGKLPGFHLKYTTLGRLNADRDNIIWVCHALTGSADVTDWWKEFFSNDSPFSPEKHFIICANILGGCYGSTGHLSINPETGKPFYHDFPQITNRDVVRAFDLLREHLGFSEIKVLIGGSLGGQHALEWAIHQPTVFKYLIPIATNAVHSPWGIAFNEAQRLALKADPTWSESDPRAGIEGLKAARAIGMLSYRHYDGFQATQSEKSDDKLDDYRASSYQKYQGEKLARRFNAFTYYLLTQMMDSHHLGRDRNGIQAALQQITATTLVIGIESDILFPLSEQRLLASHIPNASLHIIDSLFGHDGFLVESDQLKEIIHHFVQKTDNKILV